MITIEKSKTKDKYARLKEFLWALFIVAILVGFVKDEQARDRLMSSVAAGGFVVWEIIKGIFPYIMYGIAALVMFNLYMAIINISDTLTKILKELKKR